MASSKSLKRPAATRPSEPEPLWLPLPDPPSLPSAPLHELEPEPEAPEGEDEGDGVIVVEMA